MKEQFVRLSGLMGEKGVANLQKKCVAVVGLGGVGGYALEALCRCGIGKFILIDSDVIQLSNLNRQILALHSTVGRKKTELAAERAKAINPDCEVILHDIFYEGEVDMLAGADYIIDAIDTVTAKIKLISAARGLGIPIISCMGTGNKLEIGALSVADISKTKSCPLARVMRRELKARGIDNVRVVYSEEEPLHAMVADENGRHPPMSAIFVPAAAGLMLAEEVIKYFGGFDGKN